MMQWPAAGFGYKTRVRLFAPVLCAVLLLQAGACAEGKPAGGRPLPAGLDYSRARFTDPSVTSTVPWTYSFRRGQARG